MTTGNIVLLVVLVLMLVLYPVMMMRKNKKEQERQAVKKELPKQEVKDFMEFDEIEDDMIIQENGNRFVMVLKCMGINYDLMSENEMLAVEEGFGNFNVKSKSTSVWVIK